MSNKYYHEDEAYNEISRILSLPNKAVNLVKSFLLSLNKSISRMASIKRPPVLRIVISLYSDSSGQRKLSRQ